MKQEVKNKLPKILIISETFKSNTGGGITLSNLFKDYPKELLANAIEGYFIKFIESEEICDNFYSLGHKEKKIFKLFSFLFPKYPSGKYYFQKKPKENSKKENYLKNNLKKRIILSFNSILSFFGINHILIKWSISNDFGSWVNEFKPDFIYSQLGSLEMMRFTNDLVKYSGAKLAIHIMDDWPSVIGNHGLFKWYWNKKVDIEFKNCISNATILMSISEGMSKEYLNRYKAFFAPFHNPIDVKYWLNFTKKNLNISHKYVKVLYAGRIGLGTSHSLLDVAEAIEELNNDGFNIEFYIQTTSIENKLNNKLKKYNCIIQNPEVKYSELPQIFSTADILVMPIDFNRKGIEFLKFSMPTKASEFMISGTPILLYCSKEVFLYDHANRNGWAYIVSENKLTILKNGIIELIQNMKIRENLNHTSLKYAKENYDLNIVRKKFINLFISNYTGIEY